MRKRTSDEQQIWENVNLVVSTKIPGELFILEFIL